MLDYSTIDCDPSCASCSEPLASNCLTYASGSPPANGICAAIICDAPHAVDPFRSSASLALGASLPSMELVHIPLASS
jgi:hypothetical protein